MARVLLTGGGGFVGGQLATALRDRGDEVVALAHSEAAARSLAARGRTPATRGDAGAIRVVRGDVLDRDTLVDAMAGCEIVHHVAGINSHCPRDPDRLWRVNVLGPQTVVQAAARRDGTRVVFTSSAASLGEAQGTVGREDSPHRGTFLSSYEQSKYVGERAAFTAAQITGVPLVALNPTSVQGPPRTAGTGAIIIALLNRRLPAFVHTHVSIVDVRDVVAAHLLAERRGAPGARYVLSGATLTSAQALALVRELAGIDARVPFVPQGLVRRIGALSDRAYRPLGRPSPLCAARVATILHGHRYDGSLAQRELGLRYTPVADTFRATIEWARREGLAPPA